MRKRLTRRNARKRQSREHSRKPLQSKERNNANWNRGSEKCRSISNGSHYEEDQILMWKLKKAQEEWVLCGGYRRKERRIELPSSEKSNTMKIKKLKGGIKINRSLIEIVMEFTMSPEDLKEM